MRPKDLASPESRPVALADLDESDRELVLAAHEVMPRGYAPYSRFHVGAAVRSARGRIYAGANMENASYGVTTCAEVSAFAAANAAGDLDIEALAVVGGAREGGRISGTEIVTPCGRCRQVALEAQPAEGKSMRVLCCSADLGRVLLVSLDELLPYAFGPRSLARRTKAT